MTKGLFISFEGIDGSGKSTQIEKLTARLTADSFRVVAFRDPGGTEISEQVRKILLENRNAGMTAVTELFLYEAARAQIVSEKLEPALQSHDMVIIDRYTDSTVAYQGYARRVGADVVRQVNRIATGGLTPDLTLFIDVPWEVSSKRNTGKHQDRLESEGRDFFDAVRQGYLQIAKEESSRVTLIDGTKDVEAIAADIYRETTKHTSAWLLKQIQ